MIGIALRTEVYNRQFVPNVTLPSCVLGRECGRKRAGIEKAVALICASELCSHATKGV